eukprot:PhF_6_TR26083/c0_g1_i1/m.36832/K11839/USP8, UBP5; ubiquitin carboxyl-terminal hydrolase 8
MGCDQSTTRNPPQKRAASPATQRSASRRRTTIYETVHPAFESLFESYSSSVQREAHMLIPQSNSAPTDLSTVAKVMVSVTDPTQLSSIKQKHATPTEDPELSLNSIFETYCDPSSKSLTPQGLEKLLRTYFSELKNFLPALLDSLMTSVLHGLVLDEHAKQVLIESRTIQQKAIDSFLETVVGNLTMVSQDMYKQMDTNGDGVVSREEFLLMFTRCTDEVYSLQRAITSAAMDELVSKTQKYLSSVWKVTPGHCGLQNLGNTCYMNAALACLLHTYRLRAYFLSGTFQSDVNTKSSKNNKTFLETFHNVVVAVWSGQHHSYNPLSFKKALGVLCDKFASWQQHDAHELLSVVLGIIHDSLNAPKSLAYVELKEKPGVPNEIVADEWWTNHTNRNRSVVVSLFHGQLFSTVTCLTCRNESLAFDPFMFLQVPLLAGCKNVEECLAEYSRCEELAELVHCSKCKQHRPATKQVRVWRCPQYLIIHLKRFHSNGTRINVAIDVPIELPFESYCGFPAVYQLYGVVNHHGTATSGHYTSYCQVGSEFCEFDDSCVSVVPDITSKIQRSNTCYVLFYQLQS